MSESEIIFELEPGRYAVEVLRPNPGGIVPMVVSKHLTLSQAERAATELYDMENGKRYVRVVDTQPDAVRVGDETPLTLEAEGANQ